MTLSFIDRPAPAAGHVSDIAPGLRWLRMPLPFALDHVNLWLLRDRHGDDEGWAIVDCGVDDAPTRAAWAQVFAHGLDGLPVGRVIVTHMHPDHVGLAHWLTGDGGSPAHGARLWMSTADWYAARLHSRAGSGTGGEEAARFFRLHGLVDPAALDQVRARVRHYSGLVPDVPACHARLMDGQVLRIGDGDWRCIVGHGHAPEHISLYCAARGVLISGDMLLPRISTNVSVMAVEPEADPLPLYLASIERLRALPADTLVLPSHGLPFRGLHARIDALVAHHDVRLAEVVTACTAAPRSAAALLDILFRRTLDLHQTTFAMGEAIAHLHALEARGRLQRIDGADGVRRFRAVQAPPER